MTRRTLTTLAVLAVVAAAFGAGWIAHRPPQPTGSDTVPNVIGLTTKRADIRLQQAGLLLEVRPIGGGTDGVITTQSPVPGSRLVPGTSVEISARCLAALAHFLVLARRSTTRARARRDEHVDTTGTTMAP